MTERPSPVPVQTPAGMDELMAWIRGEAGSRGLGEERSWYAERITKRFRGPYDGRLLAVFDGGVAVTSDARVLAANWAELDYLVRRRRSGRDKRVIDTALEIGVGGEEISIAGNSDSREPGRDLTRAAEAAETRHAAYVLAQARAVLDRGEPYTLGAVTVDADGVRKGKRRTTWAALGRHAVTLKTGAVTFSYPNGVTYRFKGRDVVSAVAFLAVVAPKMAEKKGEISKLFDALAEAQLAPPENDEAIEAVKRASEAAATRGRLGANQKWFVSTRKVALRHRAVIGVFEKGFTLAHKETEVRAVAWWDVVRIRVSRFATQHTSDSSLEFFTRRGRPVAISSSGSYDFPVELRGHIRGVFLALQRGYGNHLIASALGDLERSGATEFGAVHLDLTGLRLRDRTLEHRDIAQVIQGDSKVEIRTRGAGSASGLTVTDDDRDAGPPEVGIGEMDPQHCVVRYRNKPVPYMRAAAQRRSRGSCSWGTGSGCWRHQSTTRYVT